MKKIQRYILLFVILLALVSPIPVEAQDRDGEPEDFFLGYCIAPTDTVLRDGDPIYGRLYMGVHSPVAEGSVVEIDFPWYLNPSFIDFGFPHIEENLYSMTADFEFSWAMEMFQFQSEGTVFTVTIHSTTESISIPSSMEAWRLLQLGDVDPCPNMGYVNYIPLFLSP